VVVIVVVDVGVHVGSLAAARGDDGVADGHHYTDDAEQQDPVTLRCTPSYLHNVRAQSVLSTTLGRQSVHRTGLHTYFSHEYSDTVVRYSSQVR
jgi:hypothetical protein